METESTRMITVIVRAAGQKALAREIEPTMVAMQEVVGGYIECVQQVHGVFEDGVLNLLVDEEGGQKQLSPNVYYRDDQPPIVGTLLAVKSNRHGEDVGLVGDEVQRVIQLIDSMRSTTPTDN